MKLKRLLHGVTVVGAVAIGGAVTGTTLALWSDQAPMAGGSVTAGTFELSVNGHAQTLDLGSWATTRSWSGSSDTESRAIPLTFRNDGTGANLRLRAAVTGVGNSNPVGVPLTVRFARGSTCTPDTPGTGYTSGSLELTDSLAPGESADACLVATVTRTSAPAAAQTATVSITFQGTQVRP